MARKCHAGRPKKSRRSTTVVSILADLVAGRGVHRVLREQDAVFENFSRPKWNGHRNRRRGSRGSFGFFLGRLGLLRRSESSKHQHRRQQRRDGSETSELCRVFNNELVRGGEARSRRSFPACELRRQDAAQGHAVFRVQKKEPGNQLRRARCLDACRVDRVIGKRLKLFDQLFRIGI